MTVRRASYAFCLDAVIYGFCKTAVFYQSCAFTGIVRHALSLPCILHTAAVHFKNKGVPFIMAALPVDSSIHAEVQCLLETFQPGMVSKAQEFLIDRASKGENLAQVESLHRLASFIPCFISTL